MTCIGASSLVIRQQLEMRYSTSTEQDRVSGRVGTNLDKGPEQDMVVMQTQTKWKTLICGLKNVNYMRLRAI